MIYIVTDGEYSDYHIEGVFLDKEKAYKYAVFATLRMPMGLAHLNFLR